MPYPQAVENLTAEIRSDVVSALAVLVGKHHRPGSSTASEVYRIVETLQVECKELCAHGLGWQDACRFAYHFGPDRERWLDDDLFPTFDADNSADNPEKTEEA